MMKPARCNLARTSRALKGIVGKFEGGEQRLAGLRNCFAVGVFFSNPQSKQISGGFASAVNAQAVSGQAQARNMRVVIAGWEILVGDFFKQDAKIHGPKVSQWNEAVNPHGAGRA